MLDNEIVFRSKTIREWFSDLSNWKYLDERLSSNIQNGGKIVVVVDDYQHCISLIKSVIPSEIEEIDLSSPTRHEIDDGKTNIIFGLENADLDDDKIKEIINLAFYPYKSAVIICEEKILSRLEEHPDYRNLSYDHTVLNTRDPKVLVQRITNSYYDFQIQNMPFMQFFCALDSCFYMWEKFGLEEHGFNLRDYINNMWGPINECFFRITEKYIIWHISKGEEKKYRDFLKEMFGETYIERFDELKLNSSEKNLDKLITLYSSNMLDFVRIFNSDLVLTPLGKELIGEERYFIPSPLVFGWERFLLRTICEYEYSIRSLESIALSRELSCHMSKIENAVEQISEQDLQISIPYHFVRLRMAALAISASRVFGSTRIPEDYLGISEYKDRLWKHCNELGGKSIQNYADSLRCVTGVFLGGEKTRSELDNFMKSEYEPERNILMCSPMLNSYIEKNTDKDISTYLDYQDFLRTFIEREFIDEIRERINRGINKSNLRSKLDVFAQILSVYGKFLYIVQVLSEIDTSELIDQMNSEFVKGFLARIEEEISNFKTSEILSNTKRGLDPVIREVCYLADFYGPTIKKPFLRLFYSEKLAEIMEDLYKQHEKEGITPDLISNLFYYYCEFSQEESKVSDFLVEFYHAINNEIVNQYPMSGQLWNVTQMRGIIHHLLGEETSVPEEIKSLKSAHIVILLIMDALSCEDWVRIRTALKPIVAKPMLTTFPTETAPCHMSIITGMFPSEHGIISNTFISKKNPRNKIVLIGEKKGEEFATEKRISFQKLDGQRIWMNNCRNYIFSSFSSKTKLNKYFKGGFDVSIRGSDKFGDEEQRLSELGTMLNKNIRSIYEGGEDARVLALILHPRVDRKGHGGIEKDETRISHEHSILAHIEGYIKTLLGRIESLTKEKPLKVFLIVTGDHGRIKKEDLARLSRLEKAKVEQNLIYKIKQTYESTEGYGSLIYWHLQRMRSSFIYSLSNIDPLTNIPDSINEEDWLILQEKDIDRIFGKGSEEYKPDLILSPKYQSFYPMKKEQAAHGGFSLHEIFVPLLIFEIGGS